MRVKRSDEITRSAIAYLQSVNGYFKSRYAEYSPWNVTVAMLHLYVLDGLNFFLSQMHFLQVFNASDVAAAPSPAQPAVRTARSTSLSRART